MSFARRAFIVLWKDVLVERRSKEALNALVFFSLLLLFVFQFALGADRERLAAAPARACSGSASCSPVSSRSDGAS